MKNDMDTLLKAALTPMDEPQAALNNRILCKVKERDQMESERNFRRRRMPVAALIAVGVLIMGSITVVAAYQFLSPAEVATEVQDDALEQAFSGENAILVNETQEIAGYRITLLGSVSGKNISSYLTTDDSGNIKADRTYTVVAMEHADGTPMPDTSSEEYGKEPFFVSHYIQGLDPATYSIMSMGGGYTEFVKDGIQYRLLEMDNIEIFADHKIYVGVNTGSFYDGAAYHYEESTGAIYRNESYVGVNALFVLPVDPGKADPEAASAYLEELDHSLSGTSESDTLAESFDELYGDEQAFVDQLTSENIDQFAKPLESTRQVCVPDENGVFRYSFQLESGAGGEGVGTVQDFFPDGKTGMCESFGWSGSGDLESLLIDTFTLNEDGTVTFVVYVPNL